MEALLTWQVYTVLGVTLIIIEAFASTFFLFPIGLALIFTALVAPFANLTVELVVFTLSTVILFVVSFKFIRPHFKNKHLLTGKDALIGRVVVVMEDIDEASQTGFVKVYADEWRAVPTTLGERISKSTTVRIDKVDGNKVFVSKNKE